MSEEVSGRAAETPILEELEGTKRRDGFLKKETNARAAQDVTIVHDQKRSRFTLRIGKSRQGCHLDYEPRNDGILEITHTFVPPRLRGQGLGMMLCDKCYDFGESRGMTLVPKCTFVRDQYHWKRESRRQGKDLT